MENAREESISKKMSALKEELKINQADADVPALDKILKNNRIIHRLYLVVGIIFLLGSVVLMFASLMMEGKSWNKIEFSRTLFFTGMGINLTALVFILAGELKLRIYKMRFLKFLNQIKSPEE